MTREEAIKYLQDLLDPYYEKKLREAVRMAIEALKQPDQKRGKWLKWEAPNGYTNGSKCSECGHTISAVPNYGTKYCPNCGAKMKENDAEIH